MGVIVNLTVEDKDDPATGAWRAAYTIINGNPGQSFEVHTNPQTNEGMLSVVKVRGPLCCWGVRGRPRAEEVRERWPCILSLPRLSCNLGHNEKSCLARVTLRKPDLETSGHWPKKAHCAQRAREGPLLCLGRVSSLPRDEPGWLSPHWGPKSESQDGEGGCCSSAEVCSLPGKGPVILAVGDPPAFGPLWSLSLVVNCGQ